MHQTAGGAVQVRDLRRCAVSRVGQQRFEPREREVLGHVLVGRVGRSGVRHPSAGRAARAAAAVDVVRRSRRVGVAEILRVPLPADAGGVELVEQGRHAGRVDAAGPTVRAFGRAAGDRVGVGGAGLGELATISCRAVLRGRAGDYRALLVAVHRAVVLVGRRRTLPADHRRVVVQREVTGAVVVLQERALRRQRLPQVAVLVQPGERRVVGLVLEDDQPHVLDRADGSSARSQRDAVRLRRRVGRGGWKRCRERAGRHDADEAYQCLYAVAAPAQSLHSCERRGDQIRRE